MLHTFAFLATVVPLVDVVVLDTFLAGSVS